MLHNKTNREILAELDNVVYGHEHAKKSLIALVNRSKLRHYQKWGEMVDKSYLLKPGKCLLMGGSGTGKTFLVQSLAEIVDFPFLIVDATKFNPTGASGGIKSDTLKRLIVSKAKEFLDKKEDTYVSIDGVIDQMVVFVDEFDKISSHYDGSSGGTWNEHTQTHFLTMFENHEELSGVSYIFAGAFSGISDDKKADRPPIGFLECEDTPEVESTEVDDEDIINYGMLPEIVGRLTSICSLDKLTEEDYYNILIDKIIPKKMSELTYYGVDDMPITKDELEQIAKSACESSQGVRYLSREIDKYFLDIEFNYEDYDY